MNKLYISGNYIIAEQDINGVIRVTEYAQNDCVYKLSDNTIYYEIKEQIGEGRLIINVADIPTWFDEAGTTAFTEATLVTFLRTNTGNFSKDGVTSFEDLTDTPSYLGNSLKWLRINQLENSLEAVESENIETYKTEWKSMPLYNGSFGVANLGNVAYRPKIKIVNRTLFITGILMLPQPTTAGGSILDTNGNGYTLQSKNFSDLYLNANDGYFIDSKNNAITSKPILPTALRPQELALRREQSVMSKTKNITGGRMRLNAWLSNLVILTDGRLYLKSMESNERNGDTGVGWNRNNPARQIVSKFNVGDKLMNYDNYRNAFDNLGLDTLRIPDLEGFTFDYSMDGNRSQDFGGFIPEFNMSYPLNNSFTLAQIKSAFDAI